jgi:uncharacterized phiE125 gp8 family phage protein
VATIVTLQDVKANLNITRSTDDAELMDFLADAVRAIEDRIGPIATRTVSEEIDEHGPRIVLSYTPVLAVQSVMIEPWLGSDPVDDTAAWRLNTTTGVLRRMVVGGSLPYYGPGSIFTVTYTVGRADVPGPVNRAIMTQVEEMWKSQRGAMPTPANSGGDMPPAYGGDSGFLGADVMALLLPYLSPPGAA